MILDLLVAANMDLFKATLDLAFLRSSPIALGSRCLSEKDSDLLLAGGRRPEAEGLPVGTTRKQIIQEHGKSRIAEPMLPEDSRAISAGYDFCVPGSNSGPPHGQGRTPHLSLFIGSVMRMSCYHQEP